MVDSFNPNLTWRYNFQWLLFSNNVSILKSKLKENPEKNNSEKKPLQKLKSPFYFSLRKPETKGSVIYTPDGYGIIQDISSSLVKIPVKINNKINEYSLEELMPDIPLTLMKMNNSTFCEEKITVPAFSNASDIIDKIELLNEGEAFFSAKIFLRGKELSRTNDSLEKLQVFPNTKIIVISSLGKPYSVNRFITSYQGWGYSNSCDGITFSPSRDIRVIGFGIYTPDKEKSSLDGVAKFVYGNDGKASPLFSKEVSVTKDEADPENKIYKFYFDKPYRVKAGDQCSCVVEMRSGNSFYGSSGTTSVTGEQDVVFSFTECVGSTNGTSSSSGQIPEIYYFV